MLQAIVSVKTCIYLWLLVLSAILAGCTDAGGVAMALVPGDSVEIPEVLQADDDSDIAESFPDEDEINIPPADPDEEDIPQETMDEDESEMDEDEPDLDENEPESDEAEVEEYTEPPLVEYSVFPDSEVQIEPCLRDRTHSSMHITNAVWSNGEGRTWFGAYNGIWIHDEEPSPLLHCDEEVGEKVICLDGRRVGGETELWAGFARGKVGRWRNGVWHFETVPEAILDDVAVVDGVENLKDWQGMIWGLAVHEDGTLAVQGPLGLALRDPSGVWSVPSCIDVDWGMPEIIENDHHGLYPPLDRRPFTGLSWVGDTLHVGAWQAIFKIDKNSGLCEKSCTTGVGNIVVIPSRADRVLAIHLQGEIAPYSSLGSHLCGGRAKVFGECREGTWSEVERQVMGGSIAAMDLQTELFYAVGIVGSRYVWPIWEYYCTVGNWVVYKGERIQSNHDSLLWTYCSLHGWVSTIDLCHANSALGQNLWFDEEEKHGWYSFGPSRIKINR